MNTNAISLPRALKLSAITGALAYGLLFNLGSAVAQVPILIAPIGFQANGDLKLELSGFYPSTYLVEYSEDLITWKPLTTKVLLSPSEIFFDPGAQTRPSRFYRATLTDRTPHADGQILVQFKMQANANAQASVLTAQNLTITEQILTAAMQDSGYPGILCVHTPGSVPDAIVALTADPAVEYAEPNYLMAHMAVSNDPRFTSGDLWGMLGDTGNQQNRFGSQATEAWAAGFTGSRDVVIGIIDEGVQFEHPDLSANIWTNPADPPNGIDDDHNGMVDDIHGWDFAGNDNTVFDGKPGSSVDLHGTHVAGTIGATGGNGQGVVGVNWQVTMVSSKFLGPNGGTLANAIRAVDYLTDLKRRRGVNLRAINNSWGGGGYSRSLHEAILRSAKADILFVAASGNSGTDNDRSPQYPAGYTTLTGTPSESASSYEAVVSVAALDRNGNLASFSCFGRNSVDIAAPGVAILSTTPFDYGSLSGTSMATPQVTGAVALYASTHPDASAAEIREAILGAGAPTSSLSGKTSTGDRLDLGTVIAPTPKPAEDIYVDVAYTAGGSNGSPSRPYRTMGEGHRAARAGAVLHIRSGVYREKLVLDKPLRLEAFGGSCQIGT